MDLIRRNTGYGLRALVHMALNPDRACFTGEELAEAAETTVEFMHKILQSLRDAGMVASKRGPGGGFRLVKSPGDIALLDVVQALQGRLTVNRCVLGLDMCDHSEACPLRPTWLKAQRELERGLAETTLGDVACTRVAQ